MGYTTKTIKVRTSNFLVEKEEGVVAEAFYPGHLLEWNSDKELIKHDSSGGHCAPLMVALEDVYQGNGVDTVYVVDDVAIALICKPGAFINVRVKDGENITVGDILESAGDGTVQAYTSGTPLGTAMSACDMSSSSAADPDPPFTVMNVGN